MRARINLWRLRRLLLLLCGALIAVSVLLFLGLQVGETHGGTVEIINGQANTDALGLPLAVFVLGAGGLLLVLSWRPKTE